MLSHHTPVLPDLDLQPGDLYLAEQPAILRTILGSCVSVTFWDPQHGFGALSHGVLPKCPGGIAATASPEHGFRYVDFSIRYLARRFEELGCAREDLHIKLFGGADVLPAPEDRKTPTIGALNCAMAEEILREEGLTVRVSDLRGNQGRRIHFHTGTGEVLLQRLAPWGDSDIVKALHLGGTEAR